MVMETPVLSITKSPVALGLGEIKFHDPYWEKAAEHAGNFMYNRERQVEHLWRNNATTSHCLPMTLELIGHWWYEASLVHRLPILQNPRRPRQFTR